MTVQDLKNWYAIACPTTGVRFDLRTLELMDADGARLHEVPWDFG